MAQAMDVDSGMQGTIRGIDPDEFDAGADAEFLYLAMRGIGTNDDQLRTLITDRTNAQRQEIAAAYAEQQDGASLLDRIKGETSGKYEATLVALMLPPAQYDAECLRSAMDGMGTDESLLNEIICTRTGEELNAIREAFQENTGQSLIQRVSDEAGTLIGRNYYRKYLVRCLEGDRPSDHVDEGSAEDDVNALEKATKGFGTSEEPIIEILATRSFPRLNLICRMYESEKGETLRSLLQSELSGNFENAIITTLDQAFSPIKLWGEKIHDSMKGLGTDDESLIRLLVSRSERDLLSIRDRFGSEFSDGSGDSLQSWVQSDTSGGYEKVLISILVACDREPIRTSGDDAVAAEEFEVVEEMVEESDPPPELPEKFRLVLQEGDEVDELVVGGAISCFTNEERDMRNDSSRYASAIQNPEFGAVFTMTNEEDGTGYLALVSNETHEAQYQDDQIHLLCGQFEDRDNRSDGAVYVLAHAGGEWRSTFVRPVLDENMCGVLRVAEGQYGLDESYALSARKGDEDEYRSEDSLYLTAAQGDGAVFQFVEVSED